MLQNNFGIRLTLKLPLHSTKTHGAKNRNISKTTNKQIISEMHGFKFASWD